MTLYRKYRPQKLADLDSAAVRNRLIRLMMSKNHTPHAFLFTGPKGTGKTSAARIIAKILNCKNISHEPADSGSFKPVDPEAVLKDPKLLATVEPCDKCESCTAIREGNNIDILEIDGASNRGIEEIRDLREKIKLTPVSARIKVYIIDEVHMLTTEAFNALLKTLEEPPAHAVFVLATTEADKMPDTIISRCIRINFQKATTDEIVSSLKRVAAGEKISIPQTVLEQIARSSEGSFRDGTKLLEQAIMEDALTETAVIKLLGRENVSVEVFIKLLSSKDTRGLLEEIIKMTDNGMNMKLFTEELLHRLHDILLAKNGFGETDRYKEIIQQLSMSEITGLIKLFSRVYTEIRGASLSYLPLEVAVIEWCEGNKKIS